MSEPATAARPIVCLDLDRTTIYSAAALDLRVPDTDAPRLLCVETYRGVPLSFLTEAAAGVFERLAAAATVVPTTTRTRAQLARVHLPGPSPRYAIAANGGHLLVDGVADPGWATAVRAAVADAAPPAAVYDRLAAGAHPFVTTLRTAEDLFVYALVDRPAVPPDWLAELSGWCAGRGWRTSLQGRKLYALPARLTKSAAAAEVRARIGGGRLLAAGDSLLDAELLAAADAALRPAHGELADAGWTAPHVAVTAATGVAAGEELLVRLLAACSPP